jgi:RNA polymerase sigma-70 factor (ECF subfamily)
MIHTDTQENAATEFEPLRPYLLRVAYSHLGSLSEAEDVVQEAWLRFIGADRDRIRDLRAWLTTVVSRLAIDALTSARARRERYIGPWLPEPVIDPPAAETDPAGRADLGESVSMALLIVLEALSPAERSAFVLHDVFGYSFDEVAQIVDRTPAATRQLAARARRAVEARRPRYPAAPDEQRELIAAFATAIEDGDLRSLLELLDPNVTFRADGGGLVPAARRIFKGAERVGRIFTAMSHHFRGRFEASPLTVNGAPGLLLAMADSPSVATFTIDRGRITVINVMRNPEKLMSLAQPVIAQEDDNMADQLVIDPVLRMRHRFSRSTDSDGSEVLHVESEVDPGGGVTAHVHPAMTETFTVLEGTCELLGGRRWEAYGRGEVMTVPPRTRHAFRNRSDAPTRVRADVRPPSTLQEFLEDAAALSRAGKLTRLGVPKPSGMLAAAVLADSHADMVELGFPLPPVAVQRVLLTPLAKLARRRGVVARGSPRS